MTLFEAIRELKEGQDVRYSDGGMRVVQWSWACPKPLFGNIHHDEWDKEVYVVERTRPKMTLARMMDQACGYIAQGLAIREQSEIAIIFRELRRYLQAHHDEIDWQAEADRKEGK